MTALIMKKVKGLLGSQKKRGNIKGWGIYRPETYKYKQASLNLPPLKPTLNNQRLSNSNDDPVIEWGQGSLDEPEEAEED